MILFVFIGKLLRIIQLYLPVISTATYTYGVSKLIQQCWMSGCSSFAIRAFLKTITSPLTRIRIYRALWTVHAWRVYASIAYNRLINARVLKNTSIPFLIGAVLLLNDQHHFWGCLAVNASPPAQAASHFSVVPSANTIMRILHGVHFSKQMSTQLETSICDASLL